MKSKNEPKDQKMTFRCTLSQKNQILETARQFNMPSSTYICDKLFNGNERNKYARRKMCCTLVTAGKYLDEMYNVIAEEETNFVSIEKILPHLNNAKKECDKLWHL